MSDEREHRHRSGGGNRWLMIVGWVAAALLAGNLVWGRLNQVGDRPQGFVSDDVVRWVTFWTPIAALVAAAVAGGYWTTLVFARREKSSLVWQRFGFGAGLLSAFVLMVLLFQSGRTETAAKRHWILCTAAALCAIQTGLFAYAAFREHRRSSGHGGRHGSGDEE